MDEVEALGFRQYYFQFTLNDYVREGLEPNVPPVAEQIDTSKRLADRIGTTELAECDYSMASQTIKELEKDGWLAVGSGDVRNRIFDFTRYLELFTR